MLIVPLHRPLTLAGFPLLTALLVLANLAVFVLLQAGDDAARARAIAYYAESGLAAREQAAYLARLPEPERSAFAAEPEQAAEPLRPLLVAERVAADPAFLAALGQGEVEGYDDDWRGRRAEYEVLRARVFTDRHVQRYDRVDPVAALTAAFLHGSAGHLVGNLLFLALLGLMVEPVLGALRLLGLYLGGALGAAAAGWAWNWGEPGAVLGASGAIAALMGATSVLWAGRRVRVFYWFFVLFDYVRVPALVLLPLWLGWELLQLAAYGHGAGVAFEAHAGGLLTGAALAFALRRAGWWNPAALDEEAAAGNGDDAALRRAQQHLGRMELREAEALLDGLASRQPPGLAVCLARFRSARLGAAPAATVAERAAALLACAPRSREERRQQADALAELDAAGIAVPLPARLALVRRLLAAGEPAAVLLEPTLADPGAAAPGPLAQAWLELGVALHDRGDAAGARRAWTLVAERFAATPQAGKARFLLAQHATPA